MKTLKYLFTALLLLCTTVATAHDFEVGGIYYNITNATNKTVAVAYRGDYYYEYSNEYTGDVVIPESVIYNGTTYSVTNIGNDAFRDCSGLTNIVIPNSVTSIGSSAFSGCFGLTSIVIPNSVTSIGNSAFSGCTGLTSIEIPSSVTSIGEQALYNTAWYNNQPDGVVYAGNILYKYKGTMPANTSIVVREGTTRIVSYAFEYCTGLASVEIPSSVTSIGSYAFYYCTGLTSIVVDGNNTKYDSRENCNAIIETETNTLILGFKNTVIPNSVTSIGSYAFDGCTGLTSIVIPNSVTSIGFSAFEDCTGLTSIEIPSSVTSIGYCAFRWCTGLTCVVIGNSVTSIGSSAFSGCSGLKTVINFSNLTFSKGSSNNGDVAYYADKVINAPNGYIDGDFVWYENEDGITLAGYLGNATELTLPTEYNGKSVTSIGSYAFSYCSGLISVEIPNSVTSIGNSAFSGCTGLISVEFNAENCTSMGDYYYPVFNGCTALSTVTIGENVKTIPSSAFYGCSGLKTVVNLSNLTFSKGSSNYGYVAYYADKVINAPNGFIDSDFVWYENESGMSLAGYFGNATELTLPTEYNGKSVTSIGNSAFKGCNDLETLYIGNSIESIGDEAFANCDRITDIKVALEKPISGSKDIFADAVYDDAILYVPIGAKYRYEKREPWNLFFDIVEMDFTGIDNVKAEPTVDASQSGKVKTVYDLQGSKVENPTNGVYIINGKKVMVK